MSRIQFGLALLIITISLPLVLWAQPDEGEYVIVSAQYGTAEHHVDVTDRLRELARADRPFRMGNSTFGIDPDHGRKKVLRIYARGSYGQVRMFEFVEGSTVDGAQFRGWSRGDWGRGGWSGNWEAAETSQPEMRAALDNLRDARRHLETASRNQGGHRTRALELVDQAIAEAEQGMQYDADH